MAQEYLERSAPIADPVPAYEREVFDSLQRKLAEPIAEDRVLLTRAETASYLGLSSKSLEQYARDKYDRLPYSKIGRRAMYRLCDVLEFVKVKQKNAQR
jgi:hypothetical protein